MSIFNSIEKNERSVISSIGNAISDVISVPLDFAKDVVKIPFNFVTSNIAGITTKVVLVVALAIAGIYVIGKFKILKDLK